MSSPSESAVPSCHIRLFDPPVEAETDESPLTRAVREIEEEVYEEFADRLERAGWLGKLILNYRMKLVLEERFEKLRPRLAWLMRRHFREDENQVQLQTVKFGPRPDSVPHS